MTNHFEKTFSGSANWAACPSCKSKDLLLTVRRFYCLCCTNEGDVSTIQSPTSRYFLARNSIRPTAMSDQIQVGSFPQNSPPDFGGILVARKLQALQEAVFMRYWEKAVQHLRTHRKFVPFALKWKCLFANPELIELKRISPAAVGVLHNNSYDSDAVAVFHTGTSPDFCTPENEEGVGTGNRLYLNFHSQGFPSVTVSAALGDIVSGKEVTPTFSRAGITPVIWSPVDWSLITYPCPDWTVRYLAGYEDGSGMNVSFAVEENLDTGEFLAQGSIRYRSTRQTGQTKRYDEPAGADEAIPILREKFMKGKGAAKEPLLFEYDMEFDLDRHQLSILGEVLQSPLWTAFGQDRIVRLGHSSPIS